MTVVFTGLSMGLAGLYIAVISFLKGSFTMGLVPVTMGLLVA